MLSPMFTDYLHSCIIIASLKGKDQRIRDKFLGNASDFDLDAIRSIVSDMTRADSADDATASSGASKAILSLQDMTKSQRESFLAANGLQEKPKKQPRERKAGSKPCTCPSSTGGAQGS